MDNQNNNFENINHIPREPDFPPKPYEYVTPQQGLNTEEAPKENIAESVQTNDSPAENIQYQTPQTESENTFKADDSTNNVNFTPKYENNDDSGIPDIPPQSFKNSFDTVNYQNQQNYQPQQNAENYQPFAQNNSGVNYPYGSNIPAQNYNVNNQNNPNFQNNQYNRYNTQSQYNQYPQQGYYQPYMQNNNVNTGYTYNQGYQQTYVNPQQTNQSINQQMNPYSKPAPATNITGVPNYANPQINNIPHKSNTGLKVFLICLAIVFGICLIGFVATISYSLGQSTNSKGVNIVDDYYDDYYYDYDDSEFVYEDHPETDYSDKINPDYAGLKLEGAVSDKNDAKYNSEYTYNAVSPSVVGIICYYGDIDDEASYATQASGIIISQDGYIITNSHVINNSKTYYTLKVITSDGKEYTAGVVGYDARTDLALIKADDATGLKPATFGKSEDMSIGSSVVAIGNPGGINYQNSITSGVISALNRTVSSNTTVKYIQSDAATNPGNSGGPLCNLYGQIIGMNTSKIVSESYEGMGFAIPSETIKTIVDQLMKNGYVTGRVKMGLVGVAVSAEEQAMYDLPAGILVDSIDPKGPLKDSDIQADDIVTKIDGESVSSFGEVYAILEKHKAGDKIKLEVYRDEYFTGKGKTFEVEVTLAEDKAE